MSVVASQLSRVCKAANQAVLESYIKTAKNDLDNAKAIEEQVDEIFYFIHGKKKSESSKPRMGCLSCRAIAYSLGNRPDKSLRQLMNGAYNGL